MISLVMDSKTRALINPFRSGEQDDFDFINAEHFELKISKLKRLSRKKTIEYVTEILDLHGTYLPEFLEDEALAVAEWRAKLIEWANSPIDEEEVMHLAENTPLPIYRDGLVLMRALSKDRKGRHLIREIDLRGAPGSSVFVAAAVGSIEEINAAVRRLKLDFEIELAPQDLTAIIEAD